MVLENIFCFDGLYISHNNTVYTKCLIFVQSILCIFNMHKQYLTEKWNNICFVAEFRVIFDILITNMYTIKIYDMIHKWNYHEIVWAIDLNRVKNLAIKMIIMIKMATLSSDAWVKNLYNMENVKTMDFQWEETLQIAFYGEQCMQCSPAEMYGCWYPKGSRSVYADQCHSK